MLHPHLLICRMCGYLWKKDLWDFQARAAQHGRFYDQKCPRCGQANTELDPDDATITMLSSRNTAWWLKNEGGKHDDT